MLQARLSDSRLPAQHEERFSLMHELTQVAFHLGPGMSIRQGSSKGSRDKYIEAQEVSGGVL